MAFVFVYTENSLESTKDYIMISVLNKVTVRGEVLSGGWECSLNSGPYAC